MATEEVKAQVVCEITRDTFIAIRHTLDHTGSLDYSGRQADRQADARRHAHTYGHRLTGRQTDVRRHAHTDRQAEHVYSSPAFITEQVTWSATLE